MLTTLTFVGSAPIPGGMAITVLGAFFAWFLVVAVVALGLKLLSMADPGKAAHSAPLHTPVPASPAATVGAASYDHTHREAA